MRSATRAPNADDSVGSDARLERLFRTEYQPMVALAYTLIGDNARAEEIVQDGFVDVIRAGDRVRRPGAYLRTAVVNGCRSELRRRSVRAIPQPEPRAALSPEADELWDVLAKLSEEQRVAVVLKYYGRFRSSEIAKMLDIPASTVRYHLREGLAALREELVS
jgi:RNA polymerase sigma-70 factor (ECF subfamily)